MVPQEVTHTSSGDRLERGGSETQAVAESPLSAKLRSLSNWVTTTIAGPGGLFLSIATAIWHPTRDAPEPHNENMMTKQGGSPFSPAIQLNEAVVAHVARRKAETIGTSHFRAAHSSTTASGQRMSIGADAPPRTTSHKQLLLRTTTSLSPQQFIIGVLTAATHADSTPVQTGKLREQDKETNRQTDRSRNPGHWN